MIDSETKRAIKKCLIANGFDATVVDELVVESKRLRDEFAMAALTGIKTKHMSIDAGVAATRAYDAADAMMVIRGINKKG